MIMLYKEWTNTFQYHITNINITKLVSLKSNGLITLRTIVIVHSIGLLFSLNPFYENIRPLSDTFEPVLETLKMCSTKQTMYNK